MDTTQWPEPLMSDAFAYLRRLLEPLVCHGSELENTATDLWTSTVRSTTFRIDISATTRGGGRATIRVFDTEERGLMYRWDTVSDYTPRDSEVANFMDFAQDHPWAMAHDRATHTLIHELVEGLLGPAERVAS